MPKEQSAGKPTTRRYSDQEKTAAVRMVRSLRAEMGTKQGTVQRVATQLRYGVESVRVWVKQTDIDDGVTAGVSTEEAAWVKALEQEVRELRRANEILRRAAHFFGRSSTARPSSRIHRPDSCHRGVSLECVDDCGGGFGEGVGGDVVVAGEAHGDALEGA